MPIIAHSHPALVATVGFDASHYTVSEDEGEVRVCVLVQEPVAVDFLFQVLFSVATGSAGLYLHAHMFWSLLHS